MLSKVTVIDKIEVLEDGTVQVREAIKIMEDTTLLSKQYHRFVLTPGQDLTGQDERVVSVCNATWTQEVVDDYRDAHS